MKMKIEFIKETKADGEVFYFTNIDDRFVDKSLSYDKDKAYMIYQNIAKNKGTYNNREVLKSIEIESDEKE